MQLTKAYLLGLSYKDLKALYGSRLEEIKANQARLSEIKAEVEAYISVQKEPLIEQVQDLQRQLGEFTALRDQMLSDRRGDLVSETTALQADMGKIKPVMMLNDAYKEEDIIAEDAPEM
jgi:hypothetical protein